MVLGSGCFDGIHSGHARYIRALKRLAHDGEPVCVAVAPDAYINGVKKRKPHWLQPDRWRAVLECGVTPIAQTQMDVSETIRTLRPRLFVKGVDWAGDIPADVRAACAEVGAVLVYVDAPGTPTSEAIG